MNNQINNIDITYQIDNVNYNYNMMNVPPPVPPTFHSVDPRLNYAKSIEQSQCFEIPIQETVCPDLMSQKSDDELNIENWLSAIGKIQINLDTTITIMTNTKKKESVKSSVKISAAKQTLKRCLEIIKQLEVTQEDLKNNVSMSSSEWKKKTSGIGTLKDEFMSIISQYENNQILDQLKKDVKARSRKRARQKRSKITKKLDKLAEIEKNKKLNKHIDQWLEGMKDTNERIKSEENMRKDAECLLSDVTRRKSDARKQLSLISALIKLRNVREGIRVQRGEKSNSENKEIFNKVTEKLTNMWEDQSKVYSKEEQGLRLMHEESVAADNSVRSTRTAKSIQQWERCLFGPKITNTSQLYEGLTSAERSLDRFIAIRKSWDTFLNLTGDGSGSKIPIGWVFPPKNAMDEWTNYLSDEI